MSMMRMPSKGRVIPRAPFSKRTAGLVSGVAAGIAFLLVALFAVPGRAAGFVDSAERYVVIPDRIGRVMAADQSAAILVFVLAPEKLVGWSRPLTRAQRAYLPAKFARLPVVGQLTGPTPTVAADAVARLRTDLIIDTG